MHDLFPSECHNVLGGFYEFSPVANLTIARDKPTVAISKYIEVEERTYLMEMGFSKKKILGRGGRFILLGQEVHMEFIQDNTLFLEGKLENIRNAIGIRQGRYLGYRGRQIIGNTYLNSQIQYLLYNMNFKKECVKKF